MLNAIRRLFGFHVHEWQDTQCVFMGPRHAHAQWCHECGDYRMVYGVKCDKKR